MKMKFIPIVVASLFAVGVHAADGAIKDGTYRAETVNFDDKGWKPFVEVTYKDGKIAAVKFDYNSQKDGHLKTTDVEYNKKMKAATGANPEEYTVKLAQGLVEKQNPENVDGVTGATHSSEDFVVLANAAIANAKAGKTDVAKVE
ncbi:FMN-binding protein [Candidatus Symbiopectobacterium sp. 'North America']|uniref:FMN-binding protein n=1 Tax=Candidatus Symbiopectobacterium sp. 'North America' TaxID=2794574 RepID=UPI001896D03E|nr:FMN-binding protein [Candidatus Symbiopectobacterium sp. 'North America']MBG6245024.1 FMN-binding protein [Candidatus Symbiopectobacterium sp. 'North America']